MASKNKFLQNELSYGTQHENKTTSKMKENEDADDINKTMEQIENSLGEIFMSINYLDNPQSTINNIPKPTQLPEELEYDDINGSLDELRENRIESSNDLVGDIPRINRDMLRLSLKLNGRPTTPTRYTSSVYSEADSGIGISSPGNKKKEEIWPRLSYQQTWGKVPSEDEGAILSRNPGSLRSNRSFNMDCRLHTPSSMRFNRSFNNGCVTPTDLHGADAVSLRSINIPMGSSDGKKIIYKADATPDHLLNVPSFEDAYASQGSFQRSAGGSFDDYRRPTRAQWANKAQFILACVGYSVGLGNIWRFPYVCYKSGGGAFLVPYVLALVICGIPLMYMELAIGQFTRRGPIGALGKLCPIMKGAGLSSVIICFIMSTYYSVIIAYSLYYFFSAFKSVAPWSDCDHVWNTNQCWMPSFNTSKPFKSKTPSQEFYENKVLQMTSGIDDLGGLRWELAACLVVAWMMVYFSIWKSVKSSGKVLYFTATFPYIIILAFLVRSLTLEGADMGLRFLFRPKWELLGDSHVWVNAAGQVFSSIGLAFGSVVSFASYNKRSNQILADTMVVTVINALTSLMVAVFAFATIGNIAAEHHTSVNDVITDGPGLVFIVYPQAMAKMPASQIWAILFFFMLLCLGLNTQFGIVEVVVTSFQDGFPNWMRKHFICHEVLVFVVCLVSFLIGIPNIFQGGIYLFQLVDHYAASISIMYLAFFEVTAIAWFYGTKRLGKNVKAMTSERISIYFRICWRLAAPAFLLSVWIFSLIDYERPTYRNGDYKYPRWAEALGWSIASLSLACIPIYAIYVYIISEGNSFKAKLKKACTPHSVICENCFETDCICQPEPQKEMENLLKTNKQPIIMPAATANNNT